MANAALLLLTAFPLVAFVRDPSGIWNATYIATFLLTSVLPTVLYVCSLWSEKAHQRELVAMSIGLKSPSGRKFVGFFHPYCNAGGGGERVLWTAIAFMQRTEPDVVSVVYSGDVNVTKEQIIEKVKARFDITLAPSSLHFVFLNSRRYVEDSTWPRFTLLGQSVGSMYLAWEAMSKFIPDLYIDTMGYAFTFHVVAWLTGIPIGAYVHYPTISTDMLARVQSRRQGHTNSNTISSSVVLSSGKLMYYRLFMYHYAKALRRASFVMANSTWTKNHVNAILQHSDPLLEALHAPFYILLLPFSLLLKVLLPSPSPHKQTTPDHADAVYPPCDTRAMASFPLTGRERILVSVAQPEKDHAAQVRALDALFRKCPEYKAGGSPVRLVLIGGVRNEGDAERVEGLRKLASELNLSDSVEFVVNASYPVMLSYLARASVGLSTMVDEHFGINVVEYMAAGVIPVAHASAGPLYDIVLPVDGQPTGFHAKTTDEFADAIRSALVLSPEEDEAMRRRGRESAVRRFSEAEFERGWEGSGWKRWL
ncbi:mannosyltransferase [Amylostereum chailletii]|nr:mannosyltransferase [Amylostereum chailletii]